MNMSYNGDELIKELKKLIEIIGLDTQIYCFFEKIEGTSFMTDFYFKEEDIEEDEVEEFETAILMTTKEALEILENQNKLI